VVAAEAVVVAEAVVEAVVVEAVVEAEVYHRQSYKSPNPGSNATRDQFRTEDLVCQPVRYSAH
jgi:hypothetical protein